MVETTTYDAGAIEEITATEGSAASRGSAIDPTLVEMMTGAAEAMPQDDEADEADGPRCEVCRCSAQQAVAKAAEHGPAVSKHFEGGGLREGYCCGCYDKLVEDIKKKKASQAEREKAKAEATARKNQVPKASLFGTAAIGEAEAVLSDVSTVVACFSGS